MQMDQFLLGAISMGFAIAGLCFLRFWRKTRDPLFALFALAFWMMALNRLGLAVWHQAHERHPYLYGARLFAFALILAAIIDKNRGRRRRG